jgi:predicted nucleotidyltransferase component of viral defense system
VVSIHQYLTSPDLMKNTVCDIVGWVTDAPENQRDFRKAVHLILSAITNRAELQETMIMKGGVLMAIRYHSERYTSDLDFSSTLLRSALDVNEFEQSFRQSLLEAVTASPYNLDCRLQRCRVNPPGLDASFVNIEISIGYAHIGTPSHQRLIKGHSPTTLTIDFNLNERILGVECLDLGDGAKLQAYEFTDLVAEKLRSLLQQEPRDRYRRQDTYDLCLLLETPITVTEKYEILKSLVEKSRSRNIDPTPDALDHPEVRRRAKRDYPTLADEVPGELPDFDESFDGILRFYRTLPWDQLV